MLKSLYLVRLSIYMEHIDNNVYSADVSLHIVPRYQSIPFESILTFTYLVFLLFISSTLLRFFVVGELSLEKQFPWLACPFSNSSRRSSDTVRSTDKMGSASPLDRLIRPFTFYWSKFQMPIWGNTTKSGDWKCFGRTFIIVLSESIASNSLNVSKPLPAQHNANNLPGFRKVNE